MMRPLVERLHKFKFRHARIDGTFKMMWPQWSSELRELHFHSVLHQNSSCDFLHRPFPNLVKFAWRQNDQLDSSQITPMLKYNPQLKEFKLDYVCYGLIDRPNRFFKPIFAYVPEIESISIRLQTEDVEPPNRRNIQRTYLGQLSKLTRLTLQFGNEESDSILAELCAISAANIPLEHLCLYEVDFDEDGYRRFVDAMSKFKQLETLKLKVILERDRDYPVSTHCTICKHCPELSTLLLLGDIYPTVEDILEIVQHSEKYRSLVVRLRSGRGSMDDNFCFKTDTYEQLLKIVESRYEKTHLKIELDKNYRVLASDDLVTAHPESLSRYEFL